MLKYSNIINCMLIVYIIKSVDLVSNQKCITPNGKNAVCKPLYDCKIMYNNTIEQSLFTFEFTQDSLCGHYITPIVCCGADEKYSKKYVDNLPETCGHWKNEKYPPWLIKVDSNKGHCLGILINKNYVLTKASCVNNQKKVRVHVLLCQTNHTCIYTVDEIKIHPIYKMPFKVSNDVALLKIHQDITGIEPICLMDEPIEVNIEVTTSLLTKYKSGYTTFNHTDITMYQDECTKKYTEATARDFCMAMNAIDCRRHSLKGSPIQFYDRESDKWLLVGMSKYCTFNPETNGLLAERLFSYIDWIKSNIS